MHQSCPFGQFWTFHTITETDTDLSQGPELMPALALTVPLFTQLKPGIFALPLSGTGTFIVASAKQFWLSKQVLPQEHPPSWLLTLVSV